MKKTILLLLLVLIIGCDKKDWYWYEKGLEAESQRDFEQALEYYQQGAQKDDCLCMSRIAQFYDLGWVVLQDDQKAFQWYQKAAEAGDYYSYIKVGKAYLYGRKEIQKDVDKAIKNFKLAAKGDPSGFTELGKVYLEGIGVDKDYKMAYEYFQKAVAQGCYDANIQLAAMYAKGHHVKQDDDKAISMLNQLVSGVDDVQNAKRYIAHDLVTIGADYLQGETVSVNYQKAFLYIELAVEWGDHGALTTLASMYAYGTGTERDIEKAESLFKRALEESDPSARFHYHYCIGGFYFQAYDPPKYDKALEHLMKAVEDPLAAPAVKASAMHQISNLYLYEAGDRYDVEKGKQWFEKAVEVYRKEAGEGWPYYMCQLAELYETGLPPTRDIEKAMFWYQKAADEGHPEAQIKVEELNKLSPFQ